MEFNIVDKKLTIDDVNQHWILDQGDLICLPVKKTDYILLDFRSRKINKGTFQLKIYSKDVSFPLHEDLADLFETLTSWCNLVWRKRAYDDITEQFADLAAIELVYPIGVPDLMVGNNQTDTMWLWDNEWIDTHISNKIGGGYNRTAFDFVNSIRPEIFNYQQVLAKIYSQNPSVSLWALNEFGNYTQRPEPAQTLTVNGKIDSIYFDLTEPMTGKIILA